jgi:cysteine desulfuration protein SufE
VSIEANQQEVISEFAMFDDWMQKYEYIIELGKELSLIQPEYKTDDNLISGCQSRVWLHATRSADGAVHYSADSDAIITKGLVALVVRIVNGEPAADIARADFHFVRDIGLQEHLSPTRSNGLASMIKQLKLYALGFAEPSKNA